MRRNWGGPRWERSPGAWRDRDESALLQLGEGPPIRGSWGATRAVSGEPEEERAPGQELGCGKDPRGPLLAETGYCQRFSHRTAGDRVTKARACSPRQENRTTQ